jgi:hypothetical protein
MVVANAMSPVDHLPNRRLFKNVVDCLMAWKTCCGRVSCRNIGDSVANDDISSGYFEWSGNYDRLGGQVAC